MTGMSNSTGQALTRREHISQSIADILTTPIGSRVMRRNYGSYIPQLIDYPATPANQLRLIAASAQAIAKWEPRTSVQNVSFSVNAQGRAQLTITRRDLASGSATTQTVTVGGAA